MAILLLLASAGASTASVLGDVDGDGRVTLRDAMRALHMALAGDGTPEEFARADIWPRPGRDTRSAGDGSVTVDDAREIVRLAIQGRTIDADPLVFTLCGDPSAGAGSPEFLADPYDIAVAPDRTIYFTEASGHRIRRISASGKLDYFCGSGRRGYVDGDARQSRFNGPFGLALGPAGFLFVADSGNHCIRRVSPEGQVTTMAGDGRAGERDGLGPRARFNTPEGIRADSLGGLWVADTGNRKIRHIDPSGRVTTVAGDGLPGLVDGPALHARLLQPTGVLPDSRDGSIWIADCGNHAIRKLTPDGKLVTISGDGVAGNVDGIACQAKFNRPYGLEWGPDGALLVADWGNEAVRRISADPVHAGSLTVSTICGGKEGDRDGPASYARLRGLMNLAAGPDGRILLADTDNQRIRVLLP